MKTLKIKKPNNKSHRKPNKSHRKPNKSHRKRNKSHRKRNKSAGTSWVGNSFGVGKTGYTHMGNIFTQLAKKKLLIN